MQSNGMGLALVTEDAAITAQSKTRHARCSVLSDSPIRNRTKLQVGDNQFKRWSTD